MANVIMINSVAPEEYNIDGDKHWREQIQWKAGETYYGLESIWASMFVANVDAQYIEEDLCTSGQK